MSEGDVLEIKNSIFIQTNIIKWLDFYEIIFYFLKSLGIFFTVIMKASDFTFISILFVQYFQYFVQYFQYFVQYFLFGLNYLYYLNCLTVLI